MNFCQAGLHEWVTGFYPDKKVRWVPPGESKLKGSQGKGGRSSYALVRPSADVRRLFGRVLRG